MIRYNATVREDVNFPKAVKNINPDIRKWKGFPESEIGEDYGFLNYNVISVKTVKEKDETRRDAKIRVVARGASKYLFGNYQTEEEVKKSGKAKTISGTSFEFTIKDARLQKAYPLWMYSKSGKFKQKEVTYDVLKAGLKPLDLYKYLDVTPKNAYTKAVWRVYLGSENVEIEGKGLKATIKGLKKGESRIEVVVTDIYGNEIEQVCKVTVR